LGVSRSASSPQLIDELRRSEDRHPHTRLSREMRGVAGHQTISAATVCDLGERFVVNVRKTLGERRGGHGFT
jgi:hypothetical protein